MTCGRSWVTCAWSMPWSYCSPVSLVLHVPVCSTVPAETQGPMVHHLPVSPIRLRDAAQRGFPASSSMSSIRTAERRPWPLLSLGKLHDRYTQTPRASPPPGHGLRAQQAYLSCGGVGFMTDLGSSDLWTVCLEWACPSGVPRGRLCCMLDARQYHHFSLTLAAPSLSCAGSVTAGWLGGIR